MTIKEQLLREIEQTSEESLINFMQVWQRAKQTYRATPSRIKISEFFRQSPLAELAANGELDLSRDQRLSPDRFIL
jgi:uncharacterized damage-inducible protein DinB